MPRGRKRKSDAGEETKVSKTAEPAEKKATKAAFSVTFEHCLLITFAANPDECNGRKAAEISEELRQEFGDMEVTMNPNKPRSKSFEINVVKADGEEINVWSGIKKGPPRKLKFPEASDIIGAIKKVI